MTSFILFFVGTIVHGRMCKIPVFKASVLTCTELRMLAISHILQFSHAVKHLLTHVIVKTHSGMGVLRWR